MEQVQIIGISVEQFQNAIVDGVNKHLQDLKQHFELKAPETFLTRQETAKLLKVDLSTLWAWAKKGKLNPVSISGKVLYRRSDIDAALVQL